MGVAARSALSIVYSPLSFRIPVFLLALHLNGRFTLLRIPFLVLNSFFLRKSSHVR